MKPYYGEQAFPQKEPLTSDCHGMSLRDYFAAAALQGAMANPAYAGMPDDRIVRGSWDMADAMLAARSAEK